MPFTEIELPPLFEKILNELKTGETIDLQTFRKKLLLLRLNKEDIKQLEKWMKQKGIIELEKTKNQYNVYILNYHEIHIDKK